MEDRRSVTRRDQGMQCWWERLREFASTLFSFPESGEGGRERTKCEVLNGRRNLVQQERARGIKFHTLTEANSCGVVGRAHTDSRSSAIWF